MVENNLIVGSTTGVVNPLPEDFSKSIYIFVRKEIEVTIPAALEEDVVLHLVPIVREGIAEEFKRDGFIQHKIEKIESDDEIYLKKDVLSMKIVATGYKKIKEAK